LDKISCKNRDNIKPLMARSPVDEKLNVKLIKWVKRKVDGELQVAGYKLQLQLVTCSL